MTRNSIRLEMSLKNLLSYDIKLHTLLILNLTLTKHKLKNISKLLKQQENYLPKL